MRKILLTAIILLVSLASFAQVQEVWAVPHTYSDESLDAANVNAVDQYGNVYVAGINRDPSGGFYVTIIKYDASGGEKWRHVYGSEDGNHFIRPVELIVKNSNVYLLTTSFSTNNVFKVLKYDLEGHFRWLTQFAGVAENHKGKAFDMDVDPAGNVYVSGYESAESSLDPTSIISIYYAVKLEGLEGEQQWVRTYNGTDPGNGSNLAYSIVADPSGNVYLTGRSQFNGKLDIATIKYNTAGVRQWVQRYNGTADGDDVGYDIAIDGGNNVYVTGYTTVANNNKNYVTIKYNTDGEQQWAQTYNGYQEYNDAAIALVVDWAGNICVTGNSHVLSSQDDFQCVTIKYNPNGTALWTSRTNNSPEDIAVDVENNVYLAGGSWPGKIATLRLNSGTGALHWMKEFNNRRGDFLFQFHPQISIAVFGNSNANVFVCGGWKPLDVEETLCDFVTIRYSQCSIVCPANITVNNDAGECGAIVTFTDVTTAGDCGGSLTYTHASGDFFPVGTTTVTVTSDETGATCSFTITVNDNQLPVLTCPANKSVNMNAGVCYATVDPGTATATDNCNVTVVGVRSDDKLLTDNYPGGITTITWTANDGTNSVSCAQTITVIDNEPPIITGESASTYVLSPPNHTMRDVTINYNTPTDNCSVTWGIEITSNELVNGTGDGDTDPDWIVIDDHHVKLRAERAANGTGRTYTITITATDGAGNTAVKTVEVKVSHNIKNPHSGKAFIVNSTVPFEGEFWDKPGNKHTAKWLIDENTTAKATITEPSGNKNGKVAGSYKFTAPGVYKLQMNVTDQNGVTHYTNTAGDLEAIVVIYDPNGGHAYGGGYYNSPAGALKSNPSATGKASYGFAMNYFKNSTNPKGETQFEFKVGTFEFNALTFDYLVISNSKAQFKGTGKIIGGQSGVGFIMTVVDGQLDGSGIDKIRMKIYNKNNGLVIYDNQPGASDADNPVGAVGANSVIVIQGNQSNSSMTKAAVEEVQETKTAEGLEITANPNPSNSYFSVQVRSNNTKKKIILQVYDVNGKMLDVRNSVTQGSSVRFGDLYRSGTYFVRVVQGKEHKELKLIKIIE